MALGAKCYKTQLGLGLVLKVMKFHSIRHSNANVRQMSRDLRKGNSKVKMSNFTISLYGILGSVHGKDLG